MLLGALLALVLSPAALGQPAQTADFRLLLDEIKGNGWLDPETARDGGDQPDYLPGSRVTGPGDPTVEIPDIEIISPEQDTIGPERGGERIGQPVVLPQRVFLVAHSRKVRRGHVDFFFAFDPSSLPGICTNWGRADAIGLPRLPWDFTFAASGGRGGGITLQFGVPLVNGVARAWLECWDFAASGMAVAVLYDTKGDLVGTADLLLPKTRDAVGGQNLAIADRYRDWFRLGDRSASEDIARFTTPVVGERVGDGVNIGEKYRGILAKGVYLRLDPHRKALFIYDTSGIYSHPRSGFPTQTGDVPQRDHGREEHRHIAWNRFLPLFLIDMYQISGDEMRLDPGADPDIDAGRINYMGDNDQYVVRIVKDNTLQGALGTGGGPLSSFTPFEPIRVKVDEFAALESDFSPSAGQAIDKVVAHELAHTLGLHHPVQLFSLNNTANLFGITQRTLLTRVFRMVGRAVGDRWFDVSAVAWKAPGYRNKSGRLLTLEHVAGRGDDAPREEDGRRVDVMVRYISIGDLGGGNSPTAVLSGGLRVHGDNHTGIVRQLTSGLTIWRIEVEKRRFLAVAVHLGTLVDRLENFENHGDFVPGGFLLWQRHLMTLSSR